MRWLNSLTLCVALTLLLGIVGLLADLIAPYDPLNTRMFRGLQPPSNVNLMGTDQLGRDVFSWVIYGIRTSLLVGLSSATIAVAIAVLIGLLSGYRGGIIGNTLMRVADVFLSIPRFMLIIVTVVLLSPRISNIILVIAIFSWPEAARVVRSEVLSIKEREYVMAAKALGSRDLDIMVSEILPNVIPTILSLWTLIIADAILTESALGFLGLSDLNYPSLGVMLMMAKNAIFVGGWWVLLFPSIALVILILVFNSLSDKLIERLSPRLG
ncbi:MAG: ABC transporter permease [Sulfolobales archaeon]|jgi:peptide/nickel transport system permease protein